MSENYFYKQKTVRKHSRHTPKTRKIITIGAYDRKQRYRNYAKISRARAQQLFDQRSQRARTLDLKTTSKKVFDVPNEYWEKYIGRSDVKGIDTKIIDYSKKETLVKTLKNNIEKAKKLKVQIVNSKDYNKKEELREKLKQLQEKHEKLVEELREFEEKEITERRKELEEKRKGTLQEDIKKIQEIKEKFRKRIKGKSEKEQWDKQKIEEFGDYNDVGILDLNKITILTTNRQFEDSMIDKQTKDRKQVKFDLDKTKFILTDDGGLYEFDDKKLCGYDKQYFERAIKSLKNPKINYQPNKPLIIQGDTFTYAIAPRVYEPDLDPYDDFYDDDDWEIMTKNKNELKEHEIKLTPKQYKKLMSFKKSDLVDKYNEIQRDFDIFIDTSFKPEKTQKHELIYRLLHKIQEIPEKKKEREKFAKDIANLAIKKLNQLKDQRDII